MECPTCKLYSSINSPTVTMKYGKIEIDWDMDRAHMWECHQDRLSEYMKDVCKKSYDKYHGLSHSGNGKYKGSFAFTLTKSPEDDLSEEDMLEAVRKIMSQTSCPVKKYAWYLEYKENGSHPHIHGVYETESGGRIEAKYFKRYWPIWDEKLSLGHGFRGGYHRPVRNDENYAQYISKDGGLSESKNIGQ